jgi:uncharacterized protein YecE (DUF72 family)
MNTKPGNPPPRAYIGTSGWNYKHWMNGVFYPHGLKPDAWLRYYSQFFDTVEVNNTFYGLPGKHVFERWRVISPPDFVFSLKASRFYTHIKRLDEPQLSMGKFFENASGLGEKLGVVLFQLPPNWGFNPERLQIMLDYLDHQELVPNLRSALEIRDESWYNPACFQMLREHNVSLVLADKPGFAAEGPVTANFIFLRRHGPGAMYASNYQEEMLSSDARKIKAWMGEGKDVYIYFNNDMAGYAVRNATRLKELMDVFQ